MKTVFADTGYWIALINRKDAYHHQAKQLAQQLATTRVVTSELVLIELLNFFSSKGAFLRKCAVQAVYDIQQDAGVVVIPQSTKLFEAGMARYGKVADKQWSLVDCTSFEIMKSKRIREALAHDVHFHQAGFVALLRSH